MFENRITISAKEAAQVLGVSMPTMYELVHSEGFPSIRVGKKFFVSVEGLKRWVNERSGIGAKQDDA